MALAAHIGKVATSTTLGGSYTECDGIKSYTLSCTNADLDTTDFKDTTGAMTKILGLANTSISLEGDLEAGDTGGQAALITAFTTKAQVFLEILPDGTNGFKVGGFITKFEIKAGVADTVGVSYDFVSSGVLTAVP